MNEIYSNSYLMNELHFYTDDIGYWIPGAKYAFFIHSTVFAECEKMLELNLELDVIWDFPLQIDKKCFDIKLIFLTIDDEEMYDYMQNIVWQSQYSFPWEDQATLYKSLSLYHELEDFISQHNLKSAIEKIEEIESISVEGENIKVITFANYIDKNYLDDKYRKFISRDYSKKPNYHYFTSAFPWYHQPLVEHLAIPIKNDQINLGLPIILRHLYYSKSINIFDLIATKLAICDFRYPEPTKSLQNEIDNLIQLILREMTLSETYIKNNIFDLVQYLTDQNFIPSRSCILYFVYTFQNYFDSVRLVFRDNKKALPRFLNFSIIEVTIKLTEQLDEISKIRERSNIQFQIDGTGFNRMTFALFFDLIQHDNVYEIILDTNSAWVANEEIKSNKKYQINTDKKVKLVLFGSNQLNFIEELVAFLKTFIYSKKLSLSINCALNSYMIFDNLEIFHLKFYEMHIDHKLLEELTQCNLKLSSISIELCTLENKIQNWELMMGLKRLLNIKINEDDSTWQFMFDYISNCLMNSNLNEFKFNKLVSITTIIEKETIGFDEVRFVMDEYKSRVLLKDLNTQQIIDLYNLKFRDVPDEIEDYDFYQ